MREILFRGKRIGSGKWMFGWLTTQFKKSTEGELISIIKSTIFGIGEHQVYTATVGQYTGLQDRSGAKIFEGDILQEDGGDHEPRGYVKYNEDEARFVLITKEGALGFAPHGEPNNDAFTDSAWWWKIGNIHDSPELLEEK